MFGATHAGMTSRELDLRPAVLLSVCPQGRGMDQHPHAVAALVSVGQPRFLTAFDDKAHHGSAGAADVERLQPACAFDLARTCLARHLPCGV